MRFKTSTRLAAGLATLLATIALPACAQPAPQAATQDADPALWVVKDADTTIYLFGTVHVLKPGLTWFDEAVKTAFDTSDTLVLEIKRPDSATMNAILAKNAILPTGTKLSQLIPAKYSKKYLKVVNSSGQPLESIERVRPVFAAITLMSDPLFKAGYDVNNGVEKKLSDAATDKHIVALETVEQQYAFINGMPISDQISMLTETLDTMPKIIKKTDDIVSNWANGEPEKLAALLNEEMDGSPKVAQVLLYDRNARWADWIAKRMDQPGTVFVAVGAGHLAGDKSVIADLKAKKLVAERVKY